MRLNPDSVIRIKALNASGGVADGEEKARGGVCLDGEKNDRMAFQARADYQNHAIGWLQRGYSPLGAGTVVRYPRIWKASGECRVGTLCYEF